MNKNFELRGIGTIAAAIMTIGTWCLYQLGGSFTSWAIMALWFIMGLSLGEILDKISQERDCFWDEIRRYDVRLSWCASDEEYEQAQEVLNQLKTWFVSFEDVSVTPLWDNHEHFNGFEVQTRSLDPIEEADLKFKGERVRTIVLYINDIGLVLERLEPWNPISRAFTRLLRR